MSTESPNHLREREERFKHRLKYIRTSDPNLPYADVARRLGVSVEKVRIGSKRLGLPAPVQGLEP